VKPTGRKGMFKMRNRCLYELLKCRIAAYRTGGLSEELRLHENLLMIFMLNGIPYRRPKCDTRETVVLITKWASLGSGTTPLTPNFSNQRNGFHSLHGAIEGTFIPGSIRSIDEEQDGSSLYELTAGNNERKKKLLGLQQGFHTIDGLARLPSHV